jgi:hypothetical protein
MTCVNMTDYVNTINSVCKTDSIIVVMDECQSYCLLSIVYMLNSCLSLLKVMDLDKELEQIIEFCFNKNNIGDGH